MTSTQTIHAARQTAKSIVKSLRQPYGNYSPSEFYWGYVQGVNGGPTPTVDLWPDGTQNTNDPAYLELGVPLLWTGYVPTVGDVVLCQRGTGWGRSSRVVLGKLQGAPSPYAMPLGGLDDAGRFVAGPNALWGGSGLPSSSIGSDGDWYMRTDQAHIYQLQSGSWVQVV